MPFEFKMPEMKTENPIVVKSTVDGGINLSADARVISDNESPNMLNFWLKLGNLRLRPGISKLVEQPYGRIVQVYPKDGNGILLRRTVKNETVTEEKYGIYIVTENAVLSYDGQSVERIADTLLFDGGWIKQYADRQFESCVIISSGSEKTSAVSAGGDDWTTKGETIYIIGSGYFLEVSPKMICYEKPTGVAHIAAACTVSDANPYVPVLYEDCTPDGVGEKVDERNMLSPKRIMKFTTGGTDFVYKLCEQNIDNVSVSATYFDQLGSIYTFDFPKDYEISIRNGNTASLDRKNGTITFSTTLVDAKALKLKNNLVVTYCKTYDDVPVKNCHIGTWYDGGTQTGTGCGRIFLSGNTDVPNRIYYSALNNPTYFAESAYIDIGANADPITAFGIQYDILAVFKRNSIYSLQYTNKGDSPSITAKMVNAKTGCDMPKTLLMISNMLVWANSAGGVFALLSTTVRDERAVRLLSQNINQSLLSLPRESLQNAAAVIDENSYYLAVDDTVFVMNYERLVFSNDKRPQNAPWFIWKLPQKLSLIMRIGRNLVGASQDDGILYIFDENAADDSGKFFEAWWHSKEFDYNDLNVLKKLCRFSFTIGSKEPLGFEISFCDAKGESCHKVYVDSTDYYKFVRFNPNSVWSCCNSFCLKRLEGDKTPFCLCGFSAEAVTGARR